MEEAENPSLKKVVLPDSESELKAMLVEYTGKQTNPEDDAVTVEMIINIMTEQFPELVLALAEENWIRGYHQAFTDIEATEASIKATQSE
jgi:hypothetical protein